MLNKAILTKAGCKTVTAGLALLLFLALLPATKLNAQDWIRTGTNRGAPIRLAVPDFKPANGDPGNPPLLSVFNETLWYDLDNAGIFEMVAKSFYPAGNPGFPNDIQLNVWGGPPPNAAMVAFGNLGVASGKVEVQGWLYDVKNTASPQILGKQYKEDATSDNARIIAHRFANEIITRLGGVPGPTESKIYFISTRGRPQGSLVHGL